METWRASLENAQQIAELDRSCYPQNPLPVAEVTRILRSPNFVVVGVGTKESPVAFVISTSNQENNIIYRLGVGSEVRRQHVASELLAVVANSRNTLCKLKETNKEGIKFLVANGFKAIQVEKEAFGEVDGILFLKQPS